jgi:hypothetical protein
MNVGPFAIVWDMLSNQNVARRLKWVHAFAISERWKEEVILVTEEMRRVGAYHQHMVQKSSQAANAMSQGSSWIERGRHALLQEVLLLWKERTEALPKQLRKGGLGDAVQME